MHPRDKLKLEIMEALKLGAMTIYELSAKVGALETRASQLAQALEELVADGYLITKESSTVGKAYEHATKNSLSDLSAKLLPHRDPIREAHAHEEARATPQYRRLPLEGADLGEDD